MDGVPRATCGERDILNLLPLSSQSLPLVIRDTVIVGSTINDRNHHPRGHARVRPRLRRARRTAPLELPHRAPERGRVLLGHLAGRVVALQRQHQHLVDDERRRGSRLGLPAHRDADELLLRRAPSGRQPLRREQSWRSTSRPASGSDASTRSTTASGTTICPRPRTCWTSPSTGGRSRPWRRSASRASSTSSWRRCSD